MLLRASLCFSKFVQYCLPKQKFKQKLTPSAGTIFRFKFEFEFEFEIHLNSTVEISKSTEKHNHRENLLLVKNIIILQINIKYLFL